MTAFSNLIPSQMTASVPDLSPRETSAVVQNLTLPLLDTNPGNATEQLKPIVNPLHAIKTQVRVTVGQVDLTVQDLLNLKLNQVVCLNQALNAPVDLTLNGQVIARGMLVAVDENFGVRITELPKTLGLSA